MLYPTSMCSAPFASQGGHTNCSAPPTSVASCCQRSRLVHMQHSMAGAGVPGMFLQATYRHAYDNSRG